MIFKNEFALADFFEYVDVIGKHFVVKSYEHENQIIYKRTVNDGLTRFNNAKEEYEYEQLIKTWGACEVGCVFEPDDYTVECWIHW